MLRKSSISAAAIAVALGTTMAVAQTPPPSQPTSPPTQRTTPTPPRTEAKPAAPVTGQIVTQDATTMLGKDLVGQSVYEPDKKTKIGSIVDLILGKDGKTVDGFVIGVGGFLGIGEKNVALKMERLQMAPQPDGSMILSMDVKKDELANAPEFKTRKEQESERVRSEPAKQPVEQKKMR